MAEKRKDPEDGGKYSFEEIRAHYANTFSKKAIKAYWDNECVPLATVPKGKGKGKGKEETKAASKGKGKGKAKAEKSKPEPKSKGKGKGKGTTKVDGKVYKLKEEKPPPRPKLSELTAQGLCVAGEALIDFLPAQTSDGGNAYRGVPGGGPFNCCIAAQRLGMPVTFLGALSKDLFGEELHGHLTKEGVNLELAPRVPNPTTLAFVARAKGEGEKYAFFKENAADRSLTKAHVKDSMLGRKFRGVHMSLGAVTLEDANMREAFTTLFKMGGTQGALRSFDPNIRENMISGTGKQYSKRIEALLRGVDLAKTSDDDAQFLYGADIKLEDLASKWFKLGPKLVIFTLGSKGAEAFVPQADGAPKSLRIPVPGAAPNTLDAEGRSVPVVDTVGAGDTFMGGVVAGCLGSDPENAPLLAQLVDKKPWDDAAIETLRGVLTKAALCAAINCSRLGADPPTAAEVEKAMKQK